MKPHTILVVDDEKYILTTLQRTLSEEGYDVHIATSGIDGLKIMQDKNVSIVVSDYRMPLMDGIEFLQKVKEGWQGAIRIMLTAYDDISIIVDAVNEVGVYQVIRKPWKNEELKAIVNDAIACYNLVKENKGPPSLLINRMSRKYKG